MLARNIFQKKKFKRKIILFVLFFIFVFVVLYIFLFNINKPVFIIPKDKEIFYVIPEDRGGEKVDNLDKKSLNLKQKNINDIKIRNPENLLFSIQFYSDNNYEKVNKFLQNIINFDENIYKLSDFYILALDTEIGISYFLTYKNFNTRKAAGNYCSKFLTKINNCLIIDTTKF